MAPIKAPSPKGRSPARRSINLSYSRVRRSWAGTIPGGLFKSLRTIPVWLDVLKDAERLCPSALVLNYTNPMSMMCLAAARTSSMRVVGLCHSVQATTSMLAKRAGVRFLARRFPH